ncbi:hypothetical protein ANANG_G00150850 [Anguilla anguilla]|uniref:Vacuolar protein-sorting-associated protein 36 n=1 Tax=Anguilla anguilla TaxID=7936 RepID=A0A9D3MD08_ANGAN|nr:hypothetical protein ANANG_G00150850 [Anguilla anguilla]
MSIKVLKNQKRLFKRENQRNCEKEMDRFVWTNGLLEMDETLVIQQRGVRLYDGDEKAKLDVGVVLLSTHRLIWRDLKNHECCMAIPLSQIIFFEEQAAGIGKSAKIVIHLHPVPPNKEPGPYQLSKFSHIKLSFKEHGQIEFFRRLNEEMTQKRWERTPASQPIPTATGSQAGRTRAVGIVGIERKLEEKRKETDKNISEAFEDLSQLMVKAKEMVELSRSIASKIKDKQGDITEDERGAGERERGPWMSVAESVSFSAGLGSRSPGAAVGGAWLLSSTRAHLFAPLPPVASKGTYRGASV